MNLRLAAAVLILLCSACATLKPANIVDSSSIRSVRTAYVVKHPRSTRGMEVALQTALASHGIRTRYGSLERKPRDADVYVTFTDRWSWDLTMYLESLDIAIYLNQTDELIASGGFRNSLLHSFPDPEETAAEVVGSIFEDLRPKRWARGARK